MRNLLIAAVTTAALAFAGAAGAQTGTSNNMNTGSNANMNMGGTAPVTTNAQQPQKMKATSRKHAAVHHRAKHKLTRKVSRHRIAHKGSAHRMAHKASSHRIAKRNTRGHLGLAANKVQQPKQQQAKKRMPMRETTGSGSAGSMQNTTSPNTKTSPNMQK